MGRKRKYATVEESKEVARRQSREYQKKLRATPEHKAKVQVKGREFNLKQYGLTIQGYDGLLELQKGVCAGCSKPQSGRRLHVDHEHVKNYSKMPFEKKRKFVRGLLCFRCNMAMGYLGNDPVKLIRVLTNLLQYTDRYLRVRNILLNLPIEVALQQAKNAVEYLESSRQSLD